MLHKENERELHPCNSNKYSCAKESTNAVFFFSFFRSLSFPLYLFSPFLSLSIWALGTEGKNTHKRTHVILFLSSLHFTLLLSLMFRSLLPSFILSSEHFA